MNANEIGERLRFLRTVNSLSQSDIAFALHITRQAYSNYELGKTEAPLFVYSQLAIIFNTSESWIMTGEGTPGTPASASPLPSADLSQLLTLLKPENAPYLKKVLKYIHTYCK